MKCLLRGGQSLVDERGGRQMTYGFAEVPRGVAPDGMPLLTGTGYRFSPRRGAAN